MIRSAAQASTIAVTDARLSQSGDWVGNEPSTASVASDSRLTETVTRTLR
jgi:hypothetical protein